METKPVLLSYCATFLKKEMLHVYRQVCGVRSFDHWVVTRKREHVERFSFPQLIELKKSPWRIFLRLAYKILRKRSVPLSSFEVNQMKAIVADKGVRLIHIYLGTEAWRLLSYLSTEKNVVKVISFHGVDVSDVLSSNQLKLLFENSDAFLARSEGLRQVLIEKGCPAEHVFLNYTGVPVSSSYCNRELGEAPFKFLQACRFIEKKSIDVTIRAIGYLRDKGISVHLDLAGDGPLRGELETLVAQLGLEKEVSFLGFLRNEELLTRFSEYILFLHPSRTTSSGDREGIPNALLEAMGHGMPCVSTKHSGIPEAITDGIEGWLIDKADPEVLSNRIEKILSDKKEYSKVSRAAYDKVKDKFSLEACRKQLELVYTSLLS